MLPVAHTTALYYAPLDISGGRAPYAIAVVSGHLAPGLHLDSTAGAITGVPTLPGTWYPTIRVIDALGNRARKPFVLGVQPATAAYCERSLLCGTTR